MNPMYQLSELERYLEKQRHERCDICKGTGWSAIMGTSHIGIDGNIDHDIEKCTNCNGTGKD